MVRARRVVGYFEGAVNTRSIAPEPGPTRPRAARSGTRSAVLESRGNKFTRRYHVRGEALGARGQGQRLNTRAAAARRQSESPYRRTALSWNSFFCSLRGRSRTIHFKAWTHFANDDFSVQTGQSPPKTTRSGPNASRQ